MEYYSAIERNKLLKIKQQMNLKIILHKKAKKQLCKVDDSIYIKF